MLFNSYVFVFIFFPICLAGYYALLAAKKQELAKLFLTGMSFWFYGYFNISYLLIMAGSIAVNYLFHRLLSKRPDRGLMALAVALNLGVLFYFKYYDFFFSTVNQVFGTSFVLRHILLPLGISFFTFQQISFIVDTWRGEVQNCSLTDYALFVSFFPQLIAGPIVNQEEMLPQFASLQVPSKDDAEQEAFWQRTAQGFALFVLGLAKKVLIADTIGKGVDYGYDNLAALGRWEAVLVIVFYSFQLYFDFSGYCDMARGLGAMLGIRIPENFRSPYKAVNIVDFWKRWHITLNRFFTKYVYIPLGGNRRGAGRMYFNLLLVFFLSGLWHGAGWNFVVWGMLHGVLYVATRFYQRRHPEKARTVPEKKSVMDHIVTDVSQIALFAYVSVAWVYFRAPGVAQANQLLQKVWLGAKGLPSLGFAECFQMDEFWYVLKVLHLDSMQISRYLLMFGALAVCVYLAMIGRNASERAQRMRFKGISAGIFGVLLLWCILTFSQVSTFLYFNF